MAAQTWIHPQATSGICSMCQPQTLRRPLLSMKDCIFPRHQQEVHARQLGLLFSSQCNFCSRSCWQNRWELDNTYYWTLMCFYLRQMLTFHCALPLIAWHVGKVTCISSERLSLTFDYKPSHETQALKHPSQPVLLVPDQIPDTYETVSAADITSCTICIPSLSCSLSAGKPAATTDVNALCIEMQ